MYFVSALWTLISLTKAKNNNTQTEFEFGCESFTILELCPFPILEYWKVWAGTIAFSDTFFYFHFCMCRKVVIALTEALQLL